MDVKKTNTHTKKILLQNTKHKYYQKQQIKEKKSMFIKLGQKNTLYNMLQVKW